MTTTHYIVTNAETGQAMGRMNLTDPMRWTDPQFASTYTDAETARDVAKAVFGFAEVLLRDTVQVVAI